MGVKLLTDFAQIIKESLELTNSKLSCEEELSKYNQKVNAIERAKNLKSK